MVFVIAGATSRSTSGVVPVTLIVYIKRRNNA
jgi:hypothetical protein